MPKTYLKFSLLAGVLLAATSQASGVVGRRLEPYDPWDPRYWAEEFFGGSGWGGYGGPWGLRWRSLGLRWPMGGLWLSVLRWLWLYGVPYYGGYWPGYGGYRPYHAAGAAAPYAAVRHSPAPRRPANRRPAKQPANNPVSPSRRVFSSISAARSAPVSSRRSRHGRHCRLADHPPPFTPHCISAAGAGTVHHRQ